MSEGVVRIIEQVRFNTVVPTVQAKGSASLNRAPAAWRMGAAVRFHRCSLRDEPGTVLKTLCPMNRRGRRHDSWVCNPGGFSEFNPAGEIAISWLRLKHHDSPTVKIQSD